MNFEEYVAERKRVFHLQKTNKECLNLLWGTISLGGEAGEFQNVVKKILRDEKGIVTPDKRRHLVAELGDLIWYFVFLCDILKIKPEEVFEFNMVKLKKRHGVE